LAGDYVISQLKTGFVGTHVRMNLLTSGKTCIGVKSEVDIAIVSDAVTTETSFAISPEGQKEMMEEFMAKFALGIYDQRCIPGFFNKITQLKTPELSQHLLGVVECKCPETGIFIDLSKTFQMLERNGGLKLKGQGSVLTDVKFPNNCATSIKITYMFATEEGNVAFDSWMNVLNCCKHFAGLLLQDMFMKEDVGDFTFTPKLLPNTSSPDLKTVIIRNSRLSSNLDEFVEKCKSRIENLTLSFQCLQQSAQVLGEQNAETKEPNVLSPARSWFVECPMDWSTVFTAFQRYQNVPMPLVDLLNIFKKLILIELAKISSYQLFQITRQHVKTIVLPNGKSKEIKDKPSIKPLGIAVDASLYITLVVTGRKTFDQISDVLYPGEYTGPPYSAMEMDELTVLLRGMNLKFNCPMELAIIAEQACAGIPFPEAVPYIPVAPVLEDILEEEEEGEEGEEEGEEGEGEGEVDKAILSERREKSSLAKRLVRNEKQEKLEKKKAISNPRKHEEKEV